MSGKILLVEDDTNLGLVLTEYLEVKDYDVTHASDGDAGWQAYQNANPDLCVLDIMLPKRDGFELAKMIRSVNQEVPIIFLSAKSLKEDKLEGFRVGADDYVTKPFSAEELLCRIEAVLRRSSKGAEPTLPDEVYSIGSYVFDYEKRSLNRNGKSEHLTGKEAELLRMLCMNKNDVLRREQALRAIWGDDSYFNGRSMDVFITKLRKHLKSDPEVEIINFHGIGFKLSDRKRQAV